MADVLSQSEIEALLSAMTGADSAEAAPDAASEERPVNAVPSAANVRQSVGRVYLPLHKRRRAAAGAALGDVRYSHTQSGLLSYEAYDFRRPDKLSKEHLRSLQLLHESFGNYFASSLSGYLRAQVQIDVVSVEPVPYDEYMKSISASLLNVLDVSPLSGQAIFELDFKILFSMIDRLLGGTGSAGKVVRDLTDIERALAANIIEFAMRDLTTAWENIHPLAFDVASTETSSQFLQIVPGNDTVVLVLFEMRMNGHSGAMSICVPYLLIKPILSKLSAQRWLASAGKRPAALYTTQLAERLRVSRVPCVARLGTAAMTVEEVVGMEVGQVIPMRIPEQGEENPSRLRTVDLVIGGHVKFRGRTGLRGKNLAVQIEEVTAAPLELVAQKDAE